MFLNRTFKVFSNLILLAIFCTGQVSAAPGNSDNTAGRNPSSNSSISVTTDLPFAPGFSEQSSIASSVSTAMNSNPVMFIENTGHLDAETHFQVQGKNSTIHFTENAIWVTVLEQTAQPSKKTEGQPTISVTEKREEATNQKGVNIKLSFVGANLHPKMESFNRLETHVSYFIGNDAEKWRADVPVWGGVRYKDLYPSIDLVITSEHGQIIQRIVAHAGADLTVVQLRADGADKVALDGDLLRLTTAVGEFTLPLLQVSNAVKTELSSPTIVGNQINSPFGNPRGEATSVNSQSGASDLLYATFLGGYGDDWGTSIALDASGAAYITGTTWSSNFPATPGAFDTSRTGSGADAFVVKLNASGTSLAYATFLGGGDGMGGIFGDNSDQGYGIAVDASGAAYITGGTNNSDFPTTPGAFDTNFAGNWDAFVAKLNADGSALVYSTFLGGSDSDWGYGIAVDASGAAYITGENSHLFPTTPGAFDTSDNGGRDAFVVKLNANGSTLAYATLFGGINDDKGEGIAIDASGSVYVTGATQSSDFPTSLGAFDTSYNGGNFDAFLVKLNVDGSALAYATFLGGLYSDWSEGGITIDTSGSVYVTGGTDSSDFPTTPGAFDISFAGMADGFVTKLKADGSALVYSTFLGGSSYDVGYGIAIDPGGSLYVTGATNSSDFPTTTGSFDASYNGNGDAFLVKLNVDGSALAYATFLGGLYSDWSKGITIDTSGSVYVTGGTDSSDFPTTPGAFDTSSGGNDAFVAKLAGVPFIKKPPLILVHGFQGIPGNSGYHCSDGIQKYNGTNSTLGFLSSWFLSDYEVWIAHLESTPTSTPSLYTNAQCLRDQINSVALVNPQPITIIAHSMGGLVSRASLYYIRGDVKIDSLYTLGSPHAGFPFDILQLIYGNTINQSAVYDMEETQMGVFNNTNENLKDVKYYFIGGDVTPPGLGWLNFPFVGPNDGLVGKYNAVGWEYPNKTFTSEWANPLSGQYWTNEVHISEWGNSYYSAPSGDLYSYSYECMKDLLKHLDPNPLFCQDATNASALMAQSTPSPLSAFTELKNGHLNAGQSISIPLQIDTSIASLFYLTWNGDTPTFTLTRPDAQVIDPAYATAHPSEVTYENFAGGAEVPPNQTYNFNTTQLGNWQLNITATTAIDYQAFAALESSRSLTSQTNADLYQIGDTAAITANLANGVTGLAGATVTAKLTRSDATVDTLSLTDQGNGAYTANYVIPNSPGYLTIELTANGTDGGTAFTRQNHLLVAIRSNNLQLTGVYGDTPNDGNSDGLYEKLDFTAQVNLASAGEYAVTADLYAGNQFVTQIGDFFNLTTGTQTITLPFDGDSIRQSMLNGPYTITNLFLTPLDTGITAQSATNVRTTSAYSYTQFGSYTIVYNLFLPLILR